MAAAAPRSNNHRVTSSGPDPQPPTAPGPPGYYGPAAWPVGFRGIGGHLLRPAPAEPTHASPPTPSGTGFSSHGGHLLSPIVSGEGGRSAVCPVCLASAALPPSGGWVPVHCRSCGTAFVATDGSPPPPAPLPAPAPRASPIAPPAPLDPRPADADRPRGFTSDVRATPDGRRRVTCPQCHRAELDIPRGAAVAVVLRCPVCHGPFLVNLEGKPAPPVPPPPAPAPAPVPDDADGRLWDSCPKCGDGAMTTETIGHVLVRTCAVCGKRVTVGRVSPPPPPHAAPRAPARREVFDRGRSAARCPYCGREGPVDHEPNPDRLVPATCSSCGNIFVADLRLSLWGKIRRLFGGG